MGFALSLTLNYPPAGSTIPSDVLVIAASSASTNFNDLTNPVVRVSPNAAYTPMTTGELSLANGTGFTTGNMGILQVPLGGRRVCMRVPLTVAGAVISSSGTLMPPNFYTGFSTQLSAMGINDTLSNQAIYAGGSMVDMGATSAPLQTKTVFYIDHSTSEFPLLMRATYSLLDDTLIGMPQSVAAGVVSLQVRFGVDPGITGAVTAYEDAATVSSNRNWDFVRSIKVALVTRTLSDDDKVSVSTLALGAPFSDLSNLTETRRRYVVDQTEVAARNLLWK